MVFQLGSTNAAVSHYQLYNLPCPNFNLLTSRGSQGKIVEGQHLIQSEDIDSLEAHLVELIDEASPYDAAIPSIIAAIVERIIASERARGEISRSARSKVVRSQNWQDLIDRTFARMAGISEEERKGLRDRLNAML